MCVEYLLDTSIYSQRLRPKPLPAEIWRWRRTGDLRLAISANCEAELLFGLEKRQSDRLWHEYETYLKDRLLCIPVDLSVAKTYAKLRIHLERTETPRADFDLVIAATGLVNNLKIATINPRHFEDIPGLIVEDWGLGDT